MEKGDLELEEVTLIQDTIRSHLYCEDNHTNLFSPTTCMPPTAENSDLELGDVDKIQGTVLQSLLDCIKNKRGHANQVLPSIYMAPRILRDINPSLFSPRVVSIGPLHREDENVQAFEGQKETYMINLLDLIIDSPKVEILNSCVQKVYTLKEKIKACYIWTKPYDDAQITKMMVMDACFILGFIFQIYEILASQSPLGEKWVFQSVIGDLILLENQIPFFVLDAIFHCTILKFDPDISLTKFLIPFLSCFKICTSELNINNISMDTTHHILGLLHECYKPPAPLMPRVGHTRIHSTVDLERAGVNFKPNINPSTWVLGMEVKLYRFPCFFGPWGNPTLRIPKLIVENDTELVLRNLIAYGQSCQTHGHITSYAFAIDMLVNTPEDVAKLGNAGVLVNRLGSNEEAANMINKLCKDVLYECSFYEEEYKKLNNFCGSSWPKNVAYVRRTYFNNPWTVIALLAGFILFVLTVVQTIFTINPVGSKE